VPPSSPPSMSSVSGHTWHHVAARLRARLAISWRRGRPARSARGPGRHAGRRSRRPRRPRARAPHPGASRRREDRGCRRPRGRRRTATTAPTGRAARAPRRARRSRGHIRAGPRPPVAGDLGMQEEARLLGGGVGLSRMMTASASGGQVISGSKWPSGHVAARPSGPPVPQERPRRGAAATARRIPPAWSVSHWRRNGKRLDRTALCLRCRDLVGAGSCGGDRAGARACAQVLAARAATCRHPSSPPVISDHLRSGGATRSSGPPCPHWGDAVR
jgi:hypothetical protein